VFRTDEYPDPRENFQAIPIDQPEPSIQVDLNDLEDIPFIESSVICSPLPGAADKVVIVTLLHPDSCLLEEIESADMIVVRMCDDDVGNVTGVEMDFL
jgi:hypothetical protein